MSDDYCPIEQGVRDSSILYALQRLHGDTSGETKLKYTFDDIPSEGDYHQIRYWVTHPEHEIPLGCGVVATDEAMTHHLIYMLYPTESTGVFFTEEYFNQE